MSSVRVMIAEDDVLQAEGIASLVAKLRPSWKILDLAHDRAQLAAGLEDFVPDVLLLDLHMPEDDAFPQTILEQIKTASPSPVVILITGDPTQALEAYQSAVADYVIKPPRPERLAQALERAERLVIALGSKAPEPPAPEAARMPTLSNQWLSGFRGRDMVMIDPAEIIYLQAERKYTIAYLPQGQILMRCGITDAEARINMSDFVRIHRSAIVQIKHIDFIRRDEMGRLRVHMKGVPGGIVVSRSFEYVFKDV